MYLSFIYLLLLNVYVSMLGMCMNMRDVKIHSTLWGYKLTFRSQFSPSTMRSGDGI